MINNKEKVSTDKAIASILGAAYGDALGWPFERLSQSSNKLKSSSGSLQDLKKWSRKSGGRYFPYEEILEEGTYSDDTQLILCLSRSLLAGEDWCQRWSDVELPFWTLYERGGGGATKRSANSWKNSKSPWSSSRDRDDVISYFSAGGNGVAMRVLPHILFYSSSENFEPIAKNIFLDGIVTHGHPTALVGAFAYGYALWRSCKRITRVEYGQIINELIEDFEIWSKFPQHINIDSSWINASNNAGYNYKSVWEQAALEMKKYFQLSKDELAKGALAIDEEIFSNLNCFDKKINGAGTVAAAAAIYLSSRYAAEPINGVVFAARAVGSDTDTIASMTGGLLGLMCGSSWLINFKDKIQDFKYLEKMSKLLVENKIEYKANKKLSAATLENWINSLILRESDENVDLPDNRVAKVISMPTQIGNSGKYKVELRKLICEDGQTIYLSKISKGDFGKSVTMTKAKVLPKETKLSRDHRVGIKLPVSSINESVKFYKDLLGLTVKKVNFDTAAFKEGVTLVLKDDTSSFYSTNNFHSLVYVQTPDIKATFETLKNNNIKIITEISMWNKTTIMFFRCLDLEGNVVEVFSASEK